MNSPDQRRFAKDRLDVGLMTDDPAMVSFMAETVGLGAPALLRVNRRSVQHRFDVRGSIIKINLVDGMTGSARAGYRHVEIVDDRVGEPRTFTGPDDVSIALVPPGHAGVEHMAVHLAVPDLAAARRFFRDGLGWEAESDTVRLGASLVKLAEDPAAPTGNPDPGATRGWSYLTVQIRDCDAETASAVAAGALVTRAPRTYGEVARFSMVTDPWGNHVELSQRASLTGPLPPNDPAEKRS